MFWHFFIYIPFYHNIYLVDHCLQLLILRLSLKQQWYGRSMSISLPFENLLLSAVWLGAQWPPFKTSSFISTYSSIEEVIECYLKYALVLHLQQLYRVHLFRRAKSRFLVSYNLVYSTRIFTPHKVSSLSFVT